VISAELGITLERATLDLLGRANRIVIDDHATTIVGGRGQKAAIQGRVEQIRLQIEKATSSYDKEKLEERLAKLAGGVAVIRVGAPSETELKRRKEAFEDAIASTKAAIDEGIVPGGGLSLLRAGDAIAAAEQGGNGHTDQITGMRILRRALEAPARQIAENSGADPGVIVDKLRSGSGNFGFDAARGQFVDLVDAGIVDPAKVVRIALENAVSVASVLLLTEATLTEEPEKERAPAQPEL
jgi:chaperonin GroEL